LTVIIQTVTDPTTTPAVTATTGELRNSLRMNRDALTSRGSSVSVLRFRFLLLLFSAQFAVDQKSVFEFPSRRAISLRASVRTLTRYIRTAQTSCEFRFFFFLFVLCLFVCLRLAFVNDEKNIMTAADWELLTGAGFVVALLSFWFVFNVWRNFIFAQNLFSCFVSCLVSGRRRPIGCFFFFFFFFCRREKDSVGAHRRFDHRCRDERLGFFFFFFFLSVLSCVCVSFLYACFIGVFSNGEERSKVT
jgi:hypothetical protein